MPKQLHSPPAAQGHNWDGPLGQSQKQRTVDKHDGQDRFESPALGLVRVQTALRWHHLLT